MCFRWFILPASLIHALVASFFFVEDPVQPDKIRCPTGQDTLHNRTRYATQLQMPMQQHPHLTVAHMYHAVSLHSGSQVSLCITLYHLTVAHMYYAVSLHSGSQVSCCITLYHVTVAHMYTLHHVASCCITLNHM